ncbi:MAG TPA: hypothetical protein VN745_05595 [Verrucomicrobiae bacterium]|nr:hypothetical protein [Verrucomicrobiae bacterium]
MCANVGLSSREIYAAEDYKTVLYRQEDGAWVAEVPAIAGCYALMGDTRKSAGGIDERF